MFTVAIIFSRAAPIESYARLDFHGEGARHLTVWLERADGGDRRLGFAILKIQFGR
jgi:hypothetical protein